MIEEVFNKLQEKFGQEAPLTVSQGKVHEYLGMTIDYSKKGKVKFGMKSYIDELINECPEDLKKGVCTTPAATHLFEVNNKEKKLDRDKAVEYHHLVAKLLYLCKRA